MGKLQIANNVKNLLAAISKEREAVAAVGSSFSDPLQMYQATSEAYNKLVRASALIEQAEAILSSTPELLDGIPLKLYQEICNSELNEPGAYDIEYLCNTIGAPNSYRRIDNLVAKILKPCQQMFDANMQRSFDFDVMHEDMERKKSKVVGILITPKLSNYKLSPDVVTSYLQSKIKKGREEYEQKNIVNNKETIEKFCHLPDAVQLWESCLYTVNRGNTFSMETGAISQIYAPVEYLLASIKKCLSKAESEKVAWVAPSE